jgi:hypothetical protein
VVRIAGMRQGWRRTRQRKGELLYHTMLDDLSDGMRILVPEALYQAQREVFGSHAPLVVEGLVSWDSQVEEAVLMVRKVWG